MNHFKTNKINSGYQRWLISFFFLVFGSISLYANENDQSEIRLKELSLGDLFNIDVAVATSNKQSLVDASGTVYVITSEDIARYGWRNLLDVMKHLPNMDIFSVGRVSGAQRGLEGGFGQTLLLINGRRFNNVRSDEIYLTGWGETIDVTNIKRIEILQGPNATNYGAYAMAGVINIVTKTSAENDSSTEINFTTAPEIRRYGLNGVFHRTYKNVELGFAANWNESRDNWKEMALWAADTNYSRANNMNTARYKGQEGYRFWSRLENFDANLRLFDFYAGVNVQNRVCDQGWDSPRAYYGSAYSISQWIMYYAGWKKTLFDKLDLSSELNNLNAFEQYINTTNPTKTAVDTAQNFGQLGVTTSGRLYDDENRTTWANKAIAKINDENNITLGYDYMLVDLPTQSISSANIVSSNIWDQGGDVPKKSSNSVYGMYDGSFFDNKIKLNAGIRYQKEERIEGQFLPKVTLTVKPKQNFAIKLSYSKGFRPVSWGELIGANQKNAPPYTTKNYEANISNDTRFGAFAIYNTLTAFYMEDKSMTFMRQNNSSFGEFTSVATFRTSAGAEDMLKWSINKDLVSGFISARYVKVSPTTIVAPNNDTLKVANRDVPTLRGQIGLACRPVKMFNFGVTAICANSYNAVAYAPGDSKRLVVETIPRSYPINFNAGLGDFNINGLKVGLDLYVVNVFNRSDLMPNNWSYSRWAAPIEPRTYELKVTAKL
jgi:outer membrane receptor protein involved in Fe transport